MQHQGHNNQPLSNRGSSRPSVYTHASVVHPQNHQNQLQNTFLNARRNSSTGGPASNLDQSTVSQVDGMHSSDTTHLNSISTYNQTQQATQQYNIEENVNISNFQQNMAAAQNINAHQYNQAPNQSYLQQATAIQQAMANHAFTKDKSRQVNAQRYPSGQQARTHRVSSQSNPNQSAIQRHSNLQNFSINQRTQNIDNTHSQTRQESNEQRVNRQNVTETQVYQNANRNARSQNRTESLGPAPAVISGGNQSSGGSIGSHSYKFGSNGQVRSRTQQASTKQSILSMIKCKCLRDQFRQSNHDLIKAVRGNKQPILMSSDNTANCGQCGKFYAIKDHHITSINQSGKTQVASQAQIISTVREKHIVFKLDDSVNEIFKKMREVSYKVLKTLRPHPIYLNRRVTRIDNLSYIADTLQSDNQTIHHAVHLMDIYSSKMNPAEQYDTLLISLVCLLISTKYLQIKYPGADTLNDMVKRRYSAQLIIDKEGEVLHTLDWNLMVYPTYDFVKLFISQGCLFENEEILRSTVDPIMDDSSIREHPTTKLAEHFKKYAEFFADFCLYQECFIVVDPYLLACAIVAYTRKYMGVAIIWPSELEMLTQCSFDSFKNFYLVIENKYTENFPRHAKSQNYAQQLLTEPIQSTAQCSIRKNGANLQLSSGDKTQKTQNSSLKQATSINALNINNLLGDLKTPDKCGFDFNSVVSGNKNLTHDKFSHEKFQINSNSVEKFRVQKAVTSSQNQKMVSNAVKAQGMVFSDNKRQSINAHSFKKQILKNQMTSNLSDEKQNPVHQPLIKNYQPPQHRESYMANNHNFASQNQTQNISATMINSVTSPSANIAETENEQEVPPFKPMIIKSNSQAIGGGYECKTTTKKSPKGVALEKINALKEAMNSVNIQAKLPSSTTNKSTTAMKLQIHNSLNNEAANQSGSKDIFSNRGGASSYGALSVGQGPIKINQKIKIMTGSNQKSSQNTAQKSQKSQGTSSSQKMKISKSYVAHLQGASSNIRQNLNSSYYQERLAEQREMRLNQAHGDKPTRQAGEPQRNVSCTSHNQKHTNPEKSFSYVSGKPKGNQVAFNQPQQTQSIGLEGSANHYGGNQPQRSALSIKNAAQVIKRKNSVQNQTVDLRVNIKQNQPKQQAVAQHSHLVPQAMLPTKNVPNGLLRRATAGTQGTQKSIGNLSNYGPTSHGHNSTIGSIQKSQIESNQAQRVSQDGSSRPSHQHQMGSQGSGETMKVSIPKNTSIGNLSPGNTKEVVQAPAILVNNGSLIKNKSFSNGAQDNSTLNATKAALMKMINERGNNTSSQTLHHSNSHSHSGNQHQFSRSNYISQPNSNEKNLVSSVTIDQPIQKLIKSGSQVLGKARQRPKMTRGQMLKDLNDKKEKMSQLVEAAHAAKCTSNEKTSSTKKPNHSDIGQRLHTAQSFPTKYTNHSQYLNAPVVSEFDLVGQQNSHSAERVQMDSNQAVYQQVPHNDENINSNNIHQQQMQGYANGNNIQMQQYSQSSAYNKQQAQTHRENQNKQNLKYGQFRA